MSRPCSACQSTNVEEIVVMSAGVQPTRASLLRRALAAGTLHADACLDCGHVDGFRTDPAALKKMLGQ